MSINVVSLIDRHPRGEPIHALDGQDFKLLIRGAYLWLEKHRAVINRLNVFPVPDGDTGTNMLLTLRKSWEEIASSEEANIGKIAGKVAHGALMGARGNSGVILSQILRGVAGSLDGYSTCDGAQLSAALRSGTDTAYKGVNKPVEGTILTVCREATEAAEAIVNLNSDLRFLCQQVTRAAHRSLENTPNLLPVLKQAGVVDSGGMGLYVIFEAFGKLLNDEVIAAVEAEQEGEDADLSELGDEWGYDIQFLVYTEQVAEHEVREKLTAMGGESIVVGGSNGVIKVHVHSQDPGPFISYGASLGHLDDIVLENMTLQTLRRKGEWREPGNSNISGISSISGINDMVQGAMEELPPSALVSGDPVVNKVGIIAVAPGAGLEEVFRSLGADTVISGGQTMNPSTEEFLQAMEALPQEQVIILPNNGNVLLAAQQAAALSGKETVVLPVKTIPEGISALLAHNPLAELAEDAASMREGSQDVKSGQVTQAVSDANIDGIQVRKGDIIGIGEGKLLSKEENVDKVVLALLRKLDANEAEIITLYYGLPVTQAATEALAAKVSDAFPDCDVEVVSGGQPYYYYILSVE